MEFDRELTRKLRDFILARGAGPHGAPASVAVTESGSPEQLALMRRVAPLAETLFLIMSADGLCRNAERTAIRGAMLTVTDDALDDGSFERLFASFTRLLEDEGLEARLGAVAAQLSVGRADTQVAIELAAAVITADDDVDPRELAALERLAELTGTDPDRVLALVD